MDGLKKILVGVDFSDYSLPTLRYAVTLAQDVGAEVVVVNVLNERDVSAVRSLQAYTDRLTVEDYINSQKEERARRIQELMDEVGCAGVEVSLICRVGVPAEEILAAIKDTRADLVVVGTKGRTNMVNTLLGAVAEKVYRRSPVSVLSVRGEEHANLVCRMAD